MCLCSCLLLSAPEHSKSFNRWEVQVHPHNTFQWKMDRVKNKLSFWFAFQDDLEVASQIDREHRQHLRTIFMRLGEHGLVINFFKSVYFYKQ
jgi:hypothetical protein